MASSPPLSSKSDEVPPPEEEEEVTNSLLTNSSSVCSSQRHKQRCSSTLSQCFRWCQRLHQTFGGVFLVIVSLIYWIQGFKSFSLLATNYLLKDEFGLQPAQSQALTTTMNIPWGIKPLYGVMSDSLPLFGYRRKSYLFLFGVVACCSYFALSVAAITSTALSATIFLFLTNLSNAVNDVVIDAKVVEMARLDPRNGANNLQSLSWSMLSIGGVMGSLLAGPALHYLGMRSVFFLASIGPILVIGMSLAMQEKYAVNNAGNAVGCLRTARDQFVLLARALRIPIVWKSALWIFLSGSISPGFAQVQFFFSTEVLKFSPEFIGTISAVGYVFLMMGTLLYNTCFSHVGFRKILCAAQLLLGLVSLIDILLVTRANLQMGIPDKIFVLGDEILSDVVSRIKTMPLLVLCAKVCPKGIEGTLFALLMSISNLSTAVSAYWGAILCHWLGITKNSYDLYWLAILIRSFLKIIPVCFLFLIPISNNPQTEIMRSHFPETTTSTSSSLDDESEIACNNLEEQEETGIEMRRLDKAHV